MALDTMKGNAVEQQDVDLKAKELFDVLAASKAEQLSLKEEIIQNDQEKIEQKDFTWDEKTKSLNYFYSIGKRDIFMSLQIVWDTIKVTFDATNTLWWNYDNEDKVIICNKKDITTLPSKISDVFESWFDFKTAFGHKENVKVSRRDTLDKIEEKAQTAIKILQKHM